MKNLGILVLGMHRSGTSALAGSLATLGVHMGSKLVSAVEGENDRGFWENRPLVEIHDRLLGSLHSSWDDVRPLPEGWLQIPEVAGFRNEIIRVLQNECLTVPYWGVKDPRLCRLMPLWFEVLEALETSCVFVLIHRDPLEVSSSLKRRDGFDEAKSGLLWIDYNLQAEKWTRGLPRVLISYAELLGDPEKTTKKIANVIGGDFVARVEQRVDAVKSFLSPRLRHHAQHFAETNHTFGTYQSLVANTYHALSEACETESSGLHDRFDQLRREYETITTNFSPALSAHVGDLQKQVGNLRQDLDRTLASTSWKATRPLRLATKLVDRIARRRPA